MGVIKDRGHISDDCCRILRTANSVPFHPENISFSAGCRGDGAPLPFTSHTIQLVGKADHSPSRNVDASRSSMSCSADNFKMFDIHHAA